MILNDTNKELYNSLPNDIKNIFNTKNTIKLNNTKSNDNKIDPNYVSKMDLELLSNGNPWNYINEVNK